MFALAAKRLPDPNVESKCSPKLQSAKGCWQVLEHQSFGSCCSSQLNTMAV